MAKEQTAVEQELAELKAQLAALMAKQPGTDALQLLAERSAPKNNPNYNEVGVFQYAEGAAVRPKPALARPTFFCGTRQREDELTPAEIEAYNALSGHKTARGGAWTADIRQNGTQQELHVDVPAKSVDDRMSLPGLLEILAELRGGTEAINRASLLERVAELEAKLSKVGAAA